MQTIHQQMLFTRDGRLELAEELCWMEQVQQEILAQMEDGSEQREDVLFTELEALEEQISQAKQALRSGTVVDNTGLVVAIGSELILAGEQGGETFTIAGPLSADPRLNRVSFESHVARVVLGHELGDTVEMDTQSGRRRLRIVAIARGKLHAGCGG